MYSNLHKRGSYMLLVSACPPPLRLNLVKTAPWSAVQIKVLLKTLPTACEVPLATRQGTFTGLEVAEEVSELADYLAVQQGLTAAEK